jgi:hypothetical protein
MSEIEKALQDASAPNFWGEVNVTYREGKPFIVRITKTTQIPQLQKVKTYDHFQIRQDSQAVMDV